MLDKDMREPLFDFLDEEWGKIRIVEEKVILGSRADVIGITDGELLGFEIKSDGDTYARLKTQIRDYERYCDRCYLVAGESHREAESHVPPYWGIIVINDEGAYMIREAELSPHVNLNLQLGLLWKAELGHILKRLDMPLYEGKSRGYIAERLIKRAESDKYPMIDEDIVKRLMTDELFERDYTIYDDQLPVTYRKTKKGVRARRKRPRTFAAHTVRRRKKNN